MLERVVTVTMLEHCLDNEGEEVRQRGVFFTMMQKVFVVGRSGSGKTTAAKIIAESIPTIAESIPTIAESIVRGNLATCRFRDYDILHKMYWKDRNHRFYKADYEGFGVIDYGVFDEALEKLASEVRNKVSSGFNGIVTIEFARNNYQRAIKKFTMDAHEKAHLLFVDCEVDKCIHRIHDRVTNPPTPDSHFVPDDIMLSYFSQDNIDYMSYFGEDTSGGKGQHYKADFPFLEKVKAIDNTYLSLETFQREVESFANLVVQSYCEECLVTR